VVTSELAGNRELDFVDNTCCVDQVGSKHQEGNRVLQNACLVSPFQLAYLSMYRMTVYFHVFLHTQCLVCVVYTRCSSLARSGTDTGLVDA